MKKIMFLVVITLSTNVTFAAQPRAEKAQEAFLNAQCNQDGARLLVEQGFASEETSAVIVDAVFTDEGVQGLYLITTYFQKGDKPFNKESATLAGVVEIAHGYVSKVKCIDPIKAAQELYKLTK